MQEQRVSPTSYPTWVRALICCLALILVTPGMPVASTPKPSPTIAVRAPSVLVEIAAQQPEARVQVIVRGAPSQAAVERLIGELGGQITVRLPIIQAVVARVSAGAALRLAQHPSVQWVSLDSPVISSNQTGNLPDGSASASTSNTYLDTLGVQQVWNMGLRGEGITIAVIDSGVEAGQDFKAANGSSRITRHLYFGLGIVALGRDSTGHGTHVAGIVAGNGANSQGQYTGIAPKANLISLRVSSAVGVSQESDAVAAMQWVLEHKAEYNIRVVNLSINSGAESSYHNSPLAAAAEVLWFNGIVVVVSSGNHDPLGLTQTADAAPANDPFVITVGASDEHGTSNRADDTIASYSAAATTVDGFVKPEIIAPGSNIISVLAQLGLWRITKPDRVVNQKYLRLSGTSMSAPMVAAAAALLLQDEPNLTPDQVKYRLLHTTGSIQAEGGQSYPYLDIYQAITISTTESSNTGLVVSELLWPAMGGVGQGSVNWNSVNWNSVNWNSVNWNSADWSTIGWNSVFFEEDLPLGILGDPTDTTDTSALTEHVFLPVISQ